MSFGAHFRGLKLIKRSHHSEVYEATMVGVGGVERRVALKQLLPEAATNEELRAAFLEEARLGAQLSCPGLVPVLEIGLVDGRPFIISELIDGESISALSGRMSQQGASLPADLALHIGLEVCRTVAFLHGATDLRGRALGLIHRDLSPNNVLVSWQGAVRVIDLGIAGSARRRALGGAKEVTGTEGYMAPEVVRGDAVTQAADVYALGCLIHFIFSGKSPIDEAGEQQRVLAGDAVQLSSAIDPELAEVLRRALAYEPTRRYVSADPMVTALWSLLRARASVEPTVALRAWLASFKPEETITKVSGVAGLFDLELLQGMVSEGYELPQYTAVAPTPMLDRPSSATSLAPTRNLPTPTRTTSLSGPPATRLVLFGLMLIAVSASATAAAYWASSRVSTPKPAPIASAAPSSPRPPVQPAIATQVFAVPNDSPIPADEAPKPDRSPDKEIARRPSKPPPTAAPPRDDGKARRALAARGLEVADLKTDPAALAAWQAYDERPSNPESERALLTAIQDLKIDQRLVSQRLERAERRLAGKLEGRADADQWERRFLDLRVVAARARTEKDLEAVLQALSNFPLESAQ